MNKLARNCCLSLLLTGLPPASSLAAESIFTHAVINFPSVAVDNAWSQIIQTQDEWQLLFDEAAAQDPTFHAGGGAPQFDFDQYTVIAGGFGSDYRTSRLMIDSVDYLGGGSTVVHALLVSPSPDCFQFRPLRYPTIAILIPKAYGYVSIVPEWIIDRCDTTTSVQPGWIPSP